MFDFSKEINEAIINANWLAIKYTDKSNKEKSFWIAVTDIDIKAKIIYCHAFNIAYSNSIMKDELGNQIKMKLFASKLNDVKIIDHTIYKVPQELITKLEKNESKNNWLNPLSGVTRLVDYYKACLLYDSSPYVTKDFWISGIDESNFDSNGICKLAEETFFELCSKKVRMLKEKNKKN